MFVLVVIAIGIVLAVSLVLGIVLWQQPLGKIVAVLSGLLLIALIAFAALVLFLAWSAEHGMPM